VLVCGCHPGDCHYIEGNYKTMRRFELLKELVSAYGLDERRVRLEWVSASEGERFALLIDEMTAELKALGPCELRPALADQGTDLDRLAAEAQAATTADPEVTHG
jgi:F420-non-reducing hydrogenase iron-sulfur subunit